MIATTSKYKMRQRVRVNVTVPSPYGAQYPGTPVNAYGKIVAVKRDGYEVEYRPFTNDRKRTQCGEFTEGEVFPA